MEVLDTFGILSATDKSSLRWDYLRHYERLFARFRDAEINILELGIGGGNSLRMWQNYFSQANIIGIDIDERARQVGGGRILVEIGSQDDLSLLDYICENYPPTIVVDDGSHQAPHILASFRHIFPKLAGGGWYAIEDLNITGSMEAVPVSPHDHFAQVAQALMHRRQADPDIDCIHIARGVVIAGKADPEARGKWLPRAAELTGRTTTANNYLWLSEKLADPEAAEGAARRAVDLHPIAINHLGLAAALERKGDFSGAVLAAEAAVRSEPDNFQCYLRLGELQARSGASSNDVERSMQLAAELAPEALREHVLSDIARKGARRT